MTPAQERALQDLWPRFGLQTGQMLNPDACFGRSAPRTLEIGFGNGQALAEMAANAPELDFFGIEVHRPGVSPGQLFTDRAQSVLDRLSFEASTGSVMHEPESDSSPGRRRDHF